MSEKIATAMMIVVGYVAALLTEATWAQLPFFVLGVATWVLLVWLVARVRA